MSHAGTLPTQHFAAPPTAAELEGLRLVRRCADLEKQMGLLQGEVYELLGEHTALVAENHALRKSLIAARRTVRARTTLLLAGQARCGHCKKWLTRDAFTIDRSRRSGLRGWCRICDSDAAARRGVA